MGIKMQISDVFVIGRATEMGAKLNFFFSSRNCSFFLHFSVSLFLYHAFIHLNPATNSCVAFSLAQNLLWRGFAVRLRYCTTFNFSFTCVCVADCGAVSVPWLVPFFAMLANSRCRQHYVLVHSPCSRTNLRKHHSLLPR